VIRSLIMSKIKQLEKTIIRTINQENFENQLYNLCPGGLNAPERLKRTYMIRTFYECLIFLVFITFLKLEKKIIIY